MNVIRKVFTLNVHSLSACPSLELSTYIVLFILKRAYKIESSEEFCEVGVRVLAFCNMIHNKEGYVSVSCSKIHCVVSVIKEENLYTSLGFLSDVLSENHMVSPWQHISPYERCD